MIQEGEVPSEDPEYLLKEFLDCQNQLVDLIKKINRTNITTKFKDEMFLADALVERDALLERRNVLANAANEASIKQDRYSRTEIKYISTINVKEIQKEVDRLSKEYRELDTKIQGLNWITDII